MKEACSRDSLESSCHQEYKFYLDSASQGHETEKQSCETRASGACAGDRFAGPGRVGKKKNKIDRVYTHTNRRTSVVNRKL